MATKKTSRHAPIQHDAEQLQREIHALGDYEHISVRADRGHLLVSPEQDPIARLTPVGAGHYGLSFHNHMGRWEPMPFVGDLRAQARNLVTTLAPYLERWNLSDTNSGSDH